MNVERMLKLADHIEFGLTGGDELNMGTWMTVHSCGTTACIAGWATKLWLTTKLWSYQDAGMEILDLTSDQADRLFYNMGEYITRSNAWSPITKHQAAAAIRRMVREEGPVEVLTPMPVEERELVEV